MPPDAITATPPRRSRNVAIRAAVLTCAQCGERLSSAANQTHCPLCGQPVPVQTRKNKARAAPPSEQIQAGAPPDLVLPLPEDGADDDNADDNGDAYRLTRPVQHCSNCQREMPDDGVLCLGCGYNNATGKHTIREYAPIDRSWDGALPLGPRLALFGAVQAFALLVLVGAYFGDLVLAGLVGWLVATLVTAFILGTFDRLDVSRRRGGYVTVTKTWRVCFMPWPSTNIPVRQYAGVTTGMTGGADMWDWLILFTLLVYGVIPGILWWHCAFHRDQFYVGLLKDHGALALELYRGWNETQTREIAQVIRDVAGYQ